jgi:hypothetical protein
MQENLFGEPLSQPPQKPIIQVKGPANKPLSAKQKKFNNLIRKIEDLQRKIDEEPARLEKLRKMIDSTLTPLVEESARNKFSLAEVLYEVSNQFDLSVKMRETVEEMILVLLESAEIDGFDVESTELAKLFFPSMDEEAEDENAASEDMDDDDDNSDPEFERMFVAEMLFRMTGVQVDPKEVPLDGEERQEFVQEFLKHFEANQQNGRRQSKGKKKKSKSDLQKESMEKEKLKSIKQIYHSLARMLHPDTETDQEAIAAKQELMKTVNQAYKANELTTLLRLEMEFIHKEESHLAELTDEKLGLYIEVLKEQAQDLEQSLADIKMSRPYSDLGDIVLIDDRTAGSMIRDEAGMIQYQILSLEAVIKELKTISRKSDFLKLAKNLEKSLLD